MSKLILLAAIATLSIGALGQTALVYPQSAVATTSINRNQMIAEASDGDGEVPDDLEASGHTSTSEIAEASDGDGEEADDLEAAENTEASDGDGEVPDALEAPEDRQTP